MPAISNRPRRVVAATIDLGEGFVVNVRFDAAALTPAWMRDATRTGNESDALQMAAAVADVVVEWDVTNDDGTAYPPTVDNLAVFSFAELGAFVEKMIEASTPSRAEGNVSASTSATPELDSTSSLVNPQNGQALSPSPAPSASQSLT